MYRRWICCGFFRVQAPSERCGHFAPDGTLASYYNTLYKGPQCSSYAAEDSNGNCIQAGLTQNNNGTPPVDTLGRTVVGNWACAAPGQGTCQFNVSNSQGTTSPYTVKPATTAVKTNFGQHGVTECSGQNCTMPVVQSVTLPK